MTDLDLRRGELTFGGKTYPIVELCITDLRSIAEGKSADQDAVSSSLLLSMKRADPACTMTKDELEAAMSYRTIVMAHTLVMQLADPEWKPAAPGELTSP